MTKQFIATLCILAVVGVAVGVGAQADNTVTATVTPETVTVTVTPTAFDYGILGTEDTKKYTDTSGGSPTPALVTATVGNTGTDLNIKGVDAAGSGSYVWTLNGSVIEADQYMHAFTNTSGGRSGNLIAASQTLETGVLADQAATFDLQISTPSTVTEIEEMSVSVIVVAVTAE